MTIRPGPGVCHRRAPGRDDVDVDVDVDQLADHPAGTCKKVWGVTARPAQRAGCERRAPARPRRLPPETYGPRSAGASVSGATLPSDQRPSDIDMFPSPPIARGRNGRFPYAATNPERPPPASRPRISCGRCDGVTPHTPRDHPAGTLEFSKSRVAAARRTPSRRYRLPRHASSFTGLPRRHPTRWRTSRHDITSRPRSRHARAASPRLTAG